MYTKANLLFLYCETPLHAGSGSSLSAIDLPIQRERYTNFPTVAGSGVKGALREWFESNKETKDNKDEILTLFGPDEDGSEHAGAVAFTDARILLFPVRSLKGVFAWITCPTVLGRLKRDAEMISTNKVSWNIPFPAKNQVFGTSDNQTAETKRSDVLIEHGMKVVLEEYSFDFSTGSDNKVNDIAKWLSDNAFPAGNEYTYWKEKIRRSLLILTDDDFTDFVQHSTEVNARIKIDNATKTVVDGALFYQEDLPCDSLLYSAAMASAPHKANPPAPVNSPDAIMTFISKLDGNRAQIGGDENIGRGIVKIKFLG